MDHSSLMMIEMTGSLPHDLSSLFPHFRGGP